MSEIASATETVSRRADWLMPLALVLSILALVAVAATFWHLQVRLQEMEIQLARRIGQFDASSQEARAAAKEARVGIESVITRIGALETRSLEVQNQQLALESVYQDLARSQDDRLLADVEQTLLLADQQLQMAGNVRAALLGLDAAETRLARMKKAQFERLREAIARDAARLRLLPAADIAGINARLEALLQSVDRLKLESEPEAGRAPAARSDTGPADWFGRLGRETWSEIKQLVRIRRMDAPGQELLAPSQTYFLRENLKLRLLSARLALLQRDQTTYRADLIAAASWVEHYFSHADALSQSLLGEIKALSGMTVTAGEADLRESLKVLRALARRDD